MPTTVMAGEGGDLDEKLTIESVITPRITVSKTVTPFYHYSSYNSIPQMRSYQEYSSEFGTMMHGVVYLQKIEKDGNLWKAYYRGTISGSI